MRRAVSVCLVTLALALLLAGCGPAPSPEVVKVTVVATKEVPVEVTRIVALASEIQQWELIVPEGVPYVEPVTPAPRLDTLEGKTVVLRWNGKRNGDRVLDRVAELLAQQVPGAQVVKMYKVDPSTAETSASDSASARIAQKAVDLGADIVIAAQADCGACTSWLVVDQVNTEKLGIPTITIVTDQFLGLGRATMESVGLADMAFVVTTHPLGTIPLDEVLAKVDLLFPELLKAATDWVPGRTEIPAANRPPYPAERITFSGTYADLNYKFYDEGWSLGLPIVPPTVEEVEEMLKVAGRQPYEVVWSAEPGMEQLTVELVAVLRVMAG